MKGLPAIAALALLLGAACTAQTAGAGAPAGAGAEAGSGAHADAHAALAVRERAFLEALAARDAAATAAHFAGDAVLHVAGMPPVRGSAAIRAFYDNVFRFLRASESAPETLRVSASGDVGYGTGRVTNVFDGEGGPVRHAGKYLLVWERRGGEWRVTAYAISSDQPEEGR